MQERVRKSWGFAKTTAIGGLVFLLPLLVVGALLGKLVQMVLPIAQAVNEWLPIEAYGSYTALVCAALGVVILLCFGAGIMARQSLGRRLSEVAEKNLTMLFPRYAIFKDQLAGNLGGELARQRIKPVLVQLPEMQRIGLEVERKGDRVTVFLPGAPDPWTGVVAIVGGGQVVPLEVEISEVLATFETLGRNSLAVMEQGMQSPP